MAERTIWERGIMPERYIVYPRILCFVLHRGDLLLLKGSPTKRLHANLYNGVGGHVERNEDVLTALRREVQEETGLSIEAPSLRAIINVEEGDKPGVLLLVFTAESSTRTVRPSQEGTLHWVPQDRLPEQDLMPDLRELWGRIRLAPVGEVLYGHATMDTQGNIRLRFASARGEET
jgi:8-oxo-dGTP diphosphatase